MLHEAAEDCRESGECPGEPRKPLGAEHHAHGDDECRNAGWMAPRRAIRRGGEVRRRGWGRRGGSIASAAGWENHRVRGWISGERLERRSGRPGRRVEQAQQRHDAAVDKFPFADIGW